MELTIEELTKPCMLCKDYLFQILTDYIKRNIDLNYAIVKDDYNWRFRVIAKSQKEISILVWHNNKSDKYWTLKDLYANNFKELVKKIEKMEKEIINYINKEHICPYCNGTGCSSDKFDVNKWFEV